MKKDIHPAYHQASVKCACGNTFQVGSTKKSLDIEICSACHPYYTGEKNIIDSTGRVDRFKRLQEKTASFAKVRSAKRSATKSSEDQGKRVKKAALSDLKKK